MDLQDIEKKAAHYLNELSESFSDDFVLQSKTNARDFLYNEEAYSLFKLILERMLRSVKTLYEQKIGVEVIADCYYEDYDSKGCLQKASYWLPLNFLSSKTLYEAFQMLYDKEKTRDRLESMLINLLTPYIKAIRATRNLTAESAALLFFIILNETLGASKIFIGVMNVKLMGREIFTNLLVGNTVDEKISPQTASKLTRYFDATRNKPRMCISSAGFWFHVDMEMGYTSGIDFSKQSLIDLILNLDLELEDVTTTVPYASQIVFKELPIYFVFKIKAMARGSQQANIGAPTNKFHSISVSHNKDNRYPDWRITFAPNKLTRENFQKCHFNVIK